MEDNNKLISSASRGPESPTGMEEERPSGVLGNLREAWRAATKGTVVSSIFILLTTCIGAGTLSLPYAFSQGGIFVFSILFFLIMLMSIYVGSMLISSKWYCSEIYPDMNVWSYEDLAYASFGIIGRIVSLLTIACLLFLALIAYMIYTRDQLAAVMQFIVSKTGMDGCTPLLKCGVLMCIAFFPIFPVTLLRKLTPLQFTSYLSIILVALFITINTIKVHIQNDLPKDHNIDLAPQGFEAVLTVISYCSLSFICHFQLLPLQKELPEKRQTKGRLYFIVVGAIVMAYLIYNVVIFSAYFNNYGDVKSDVMLNYGNDNVLITVARGFLFFTILLHYPVLLHPTRANINGAVYLIYQVISKRFFKKNSSIQQEKPLLTSRTSESKDEYTGEFKVPTWVWFLETVAIFCATFIIATFINDVGKVWNFVGSTAGVLVLYIYPSACYLRLRYVSNKAKADRTGTSMLSQYNIYSVAQEGLAWFIFGLGLILLVVENYQAIKAVVDGGGGNSTTNATSVGVCNLFCAKDTPLNNETFGIMMEF